MCLTHWKLKRSWETFYLIKISKEYDTNCDDDDYDDDDDDDDDTDDYGHTMKKGQKHVGVKIVDQTKHKFTTKCTFFSKDSIVYHWEHKKRFYVHWWWIVPGNTICWTFWLHYIVESLININTKTICHCTLLHWRQLLCSVILY